jgi:hypothetical protein
MTSKVFRAFVLVASIGAMPVSAQKTNPIPTQRDSAGIRIIEYRTLGPVAPPVSALGKSPFPSGLDLLPDAFLLSVKPYLDLGGLRGSSDEEFDAAHAMLDVAELPDGRVAVSDFSALKLFGADGKHIGTFGRFGRGPGEFRQTRAICLIGRDTLLLVDLDYRTSLWTADGKHIQTFARRGIVAPPTCGDNGALIVKGSAIPDAHGRVEYRSMQADGGKSRSLGHFPNHFQLPATNIQLVGSSLFVSPGTTFELRVENSSGSVRRITRFSKPPVVLTDAQWRATVEARFPRKWRSVESDAFIAKIIALPPDQRHPAYHRVLVDQSRRTWVEDVSLFPGWTVLDSAGLLLGRVRLAPMTSGGRPRLIRVMSDHIVVRDLDADGAAHVRFFKFSETKH